MMGTQCTANADQLNAGVMSELSFVFEGVRGFCDLQNTEAFIAFDECTLSK